MIQSQSVFKDETKLDISYVPQRLPHRDYELRLLMEFFSFALQFPGKMTQRVIIAGDVGTGKTVLSQRFGFDVTREASKRNIKLRYIHVNCRQYKGSLFFILQHAALTFHPNLPRRGYSAEELLGIFLQILDEENAYVILALDEFESLIQREGSEAVYKLTRLQELRQNTLQRLSLICILRDLKAIERLDAGTRSTLQSNIIKLEGYSKRQLVDILNDRVSLAFKPLAVPEDTINLVADLASSEGGNARFAIELLWRAGKYADAEGSSVVTPENVRKAISSVIPIRKSELSLLSFHEKLFLLGLARIFKGSQRASVTLTEAEQAYAVVCEEFNEKPHSHTQLWKHLQSLSIMGIVKTEVSSVGTRGRSTLVYLPRISADELNKELQAILEKEEDENLWN
ncbi:MAG: ORC1-type DNA replication protein [Candidatus Bathyarchaeia archaeon]